MEEKEKKEKVLAVQKLVWWLVTALLVQSKDNAMFSEGFSQCLTMSIPELFADGRVTTDRKSEFFQMM